MDKVDHIHHVEDLALIDYRSACAALSALQQQSYKIKYDGAPALVFGMCPEEDRFFLSTKSYFNKTPKINYSVADIYENHSKRSPGLAEKLVEIMPAMRKFYKDLRCLYKDTSIFQGDLLFYGTPEDGSFTPNTITYKFKGLENSWKDYTLGIALHTRYDNKTGISYQMGHLDDEGSNHKVFMPQKEVWNYHDKALLRLVEDAFSNIKLFDYTTLTRVNPSEPIKEINYLIRNGIEINEQTLSSALYKYNYSSEILRFYLELLNYKRLLIEYLDNRTSYDNLKMFIGDKQIGHEGYVTRAGGSLTKLVHRDIFSYRNFEKNG